MVLLLCGSRQSADAGLDAELLGAAAVDRSYWSLESTSVSKLAPALHETASGLSRPCHEELRVKGAKFIRA